jgi:predicted HTH domain antitoxin
MIFLPDFKNYKRPQPTVKNIQSILLEIPEEIASQIKLPPKRAKMMLMEELVLRLYEQGIITSAHGASLLKKDRVSFERFLAEHEIAFHGDPDDLDSDLANLEQAL